MHAVAEAARNVAAVGARPWAATNCLNFGNPEKPEVMWQFSEAVDGMAEACRALSIPITGGNVSFYNDTLGKSIDPTPIVGVLGVMENAAETLTMAFRNEGDAIVLLDGRTDAASAAHSDAGQRESLREFASSEYARTVAGIVAGVPPAIDLAAESRLIETLVALAGEGILASAHDISDGGIAVALAECGFASNGLAAEAAWHTNEPAELTLFAETGARAVVSLSQASLARLLTLAAQYKLTASVIGRVTRGQFQLSLNGATVVRDHPASLGEIWSGAIEHAVLGEQASK
jgi:phosphoribosylformylglycinamidine synthase